MRAHCPVQVQVVTRTTITTSPQPDPDPSSPNMPDAPEERLRQYSQDLAAYTLDKLQKWRASMEHESKEAERFASARRSSRTHGSYSRKCSQQAVVSA
ncbi:hypothetical protein PAXINDRAFT_101550 [Paxillus involutus ATCC 200175]|uniref:Uncharacterized protein n=1 Tax=Paxillus involutus ATCC 200175 TaxID=664439 RepID=A0A0C9TVN1_PAXIN|nr:hypothetical protein PAXINDRAFT_101550 [Paxillus involutus ATCC 200175]